jgi:CRP/FNR family transcriptional regulator, anaerobic regulatory protein
LQDKTTILAPLFAMLNEIKPISEDLQKALGDSFTIQEVKKETILLHEGSVCKNCWFLAEGLMRSYHNIDDKDITARIMFTTNIVISPGSFFRQIPAIESIETLSDCIVGVLSFVDLQKLYAAFPEFNYHVRLITELYFYKQEQFLYMLRKHDAIAKYEYFVENFGTILKDIPQKYIATFLNIAPETLSRVRAKMGKGK